jgi:hypothetical protein
MGTIKTNGANFANLGSIPKSTKVFMTEVEIIHQKVKFIKYLNPDREWF